MLHEIFDQEQIVAQQGGKNMEKKNKETLQHNRKKRRMKRDTRKRITERKLTHFENFKSFLKWLGMVSTLLQGTPEYQASLYKKKNSLVGYAGPC
jgi:hypothetical protein